MKRRLQLGKLQFTICHELWRDNCTIDDLTAGISVIQGNLQHSLDSLQGRGLVTCRRGVYRLTTLGEEATVRGIKAGRVPGSTKHTPDRYVRRIAS